MVALRGGKYEAPGFRRCSDHDARKYDNRGDCGSSPHGATARGCCSFLCCSAQARKFVWSIVCHRPEKVVRGGWEMMGVFLGWLAHCGKVDRPPTPSPFPSRGRGWVHRCYNQDRKPNSAFKGLNESKSFRHSGWAIIVLIARAPEGSARQDKLRDNVP